MKGKHIAILDSYFLKVRKPDFISLVVSFRFSRHLFSLVNFHHFFSICIIVVYGKINIVLYCIVHDRVPHKILHLGPVQTKNVKPKSE